MTVRVVAFGRVRELLGWSERPLTLDGSPRVSDAWAALAGATATLTELTAATRVARNGVVATGDELLCDGDELALLPPVGGG